MRSLPGSKRSEREVRGFGHRLQATGNRPLPTVHRQPIHPRATAQRRDVQTSGKASVVSNRGELCGVSPSPAARGGGRTGGILLRSSARRHPPSVHCPPSSAIRIGVHLCPSVVNLSVHRFPEFMRSGFFEIAPIPDPSILPRATAQRRDVRASMRSRASLRPSRSPTTGYRSPATGHR